ncbi:phthiocerol/phthiodiolone dimycocerosyl transferase family protein [Actinomadura rubteroloni]|uniref:phthiocerol/phthiodiolone dimycocerosyl transferase family protein n=1 Tax=Actinomadura rubteroloni TaxID=1926885 RepID=UPI000CD9F6A7|nr:acyltransferase [Actinomadura rubteroloni]
MESFLAMLGMPVFGSWTVRGPVDTGRLQRAFEAVHELYPVLAARLVNGSGKISLELPKTTAVPAVQFASHPQHLLPFALEDPLARLVVSPHGDGSHIITLAVNHVITDALSFITVLDVLRNVYTEGTVTRRPEEQGEGRLPEPFTHWLDDPTAAPEWRPPTFPGKGESLPARARKEGPASSPGHARVESLAVSAGEMSGLDRAAAEGGTDVNAVLWAVALLAVRAQIKPADVPVRLTATMNVDLRRRCRPPLPQDRLCLAASYIPLGMEITPDADPLELARTVRRAVLSGFARRTPEAIALAATPELPEFTEALPSVMIAFLGSIAFPTPLNPEREDHDLLLFSRPPGPFPLIIMYLIDGHLHITISARAEDHTAEQLKALSENIGVRVHRLAENYLKG